MIEQDTQIIFNNRIARNTFLMGLMSHQIVTEAKPGQFVMIRVGSEKDPLLRRPFSICKTGPDGIFLILYRVVGHGTSIMSMSPKGKQISVLGPLGCGFHIPEDDCKSILVAGGVGIAPLIFLAHSMKSRDFIFMAGYSSADEVIPLHMVGLDKTDVSIATDDGTMGYKGTVTEILHSHVHKSVGKKRLIFTCGPLPMLKKVSSLAIARQIPCQVSLEATMACGLGACQGCAVKASNKEGLAYFSVCRHGPVFHVDSLDWRHI
jgi:dihydroorotate dehydrogenase electron transfer subunit